MYKRRDFKDMQAEALPPVNNRAGKRSEAGMLREELHNAQKALNELQKQLVEARRVRSEEREAVCNMAGEILAPDEINALDNLTSPVISDAAQKKIWALKSQLAKYEEIIASMPKLLEYNERLRVENEYLRQGG